MATPRRRAFFLPLVLALLVAACGGSGEPEQPAEVEVNPEVMAWVERLCTGLATLGDRLQTRSEELGTEVGRLEEGDFRGLKKLVVDFVGDAVGETEDLIAEIEAAEAPPLEDGAEVESTILVLLGEVRDLFAEGRDAIADLPVSDPQALAEGLSAASTSIAEGGAALENAFDESGIGLGGGQLEAAFADAPACSELSA